MKKNASKGLILHVGKVDKPVSVWRNEIERLKQNWFSAKKVNVKVSFRLG